MILPVIPLYQRVEKITNNHNSFLRLQFGIQKSLSNLADIKGEYLHCLKHLSALLSNSKSSSLKHIRRPSLQEVLNEIKRVEGGSSMPNKNP